MLHWFFLLLAPCWASAFDKDALFQEFVSKVSASLSESVPLPDVFYGWTDRTLIFWKSACNVTCHKGHANMSVPVTVPDQDPVIQLGNVLEGSALVPDFRFYFSDCRTEVYIEGIEHYSGTVGDGSIQFRLTLQDSEEGCQVKAESKFGDFLDIQFDHDITGARLVDAFKKLPQLKRSFEASIIKGMDSHLSQFQDVLLPQRCQLS